MLEIFPWVDLLKMSRNGNSTLKIGFYYQIGFDDLVEYSTASHFQLFIEIQTSGISIGGDEHPPVPQKIGGETMVR